MGQDPGIPGWFIALAVVMIMVGVGATLWRVSVARRMAEDAGLDPNTAAKAVLLSNDGLDATYLASTLASRSRAPSPLPAQPAKTTEQRLQEIQALKDKGLVSDAEYEAQRQKILGSI